MLQWVPIVYYGTEQAYNGGNDPDNRNSLWPNFKTDHDMYKVCSIFTSLLFMYSFEQNVYYRYAFYFTKCVTRI